MIRLFRWVRRHLGLAVELAAYGFWLLVDLVVVTSSTTPLALVPAVAVPLIVLLRRRPQARLVPTAAAALTVSVLVSVLARTPLALLAPAGSTVFTLSFTEQLTLAVVVVLVLHRCELRPALVLTAVAAVAIVGSPVLRMTDTNANSFSVLSALGWGGAVAIGLVLREVDTRRRAAVEDTRSAERMELARELHDVVAHHVTGIVVAAQAAAVVARTSPDDVDRALHAIETAGTDALTAMRRMVGVLRGQDTEGARTPGAELGEVPALVARFDPDGRLVRLVTDPGLEHAVLPPGVAATGYRVVQEALTNVRRHAPEAATVEVDVRIREEALLVTVRNDGVPPGPMTPRAGGSGFGLVGMGERVTALDGALAAGPTAPGVWTVSARLPLRGSR
ncbi:sensor histidine kinase [Pseudonocardia kunmingensis]|uniref:histidine kinase n=1 Tax=Pseudonocardia kunmingensis TaxID=630975 RepID=A0A543E291_9PSEU|nr:histidine kinase [Pseudonocardia kunmingensis]TQM15708.1 signal transduction histidine kinase [Pseudonocardia kunmingensis]